MLTKTKSIDLMSKGIRDAIVDQLRACKTTEQILDFEKRFNEQTSEGPLHEIICDFLRTRSISRGLAAKWLTTLLKDRESRLKNN